MAESREVYDVPVAHVEEAAKTDKAPGKRTNHGKDKRNLVN